MHKGRVASEDCTANSQPIPLKTSHPSRFRFSAQYVGLTYSRAPAVLSKRACWNALLGCKPKPTFLCVSEERHRDGSLHLHVLAHYGTRPNITSARHWDVSGCHPSASTIYDAAGWAKYITKEDPAPLCSPGFLELLQSKFPERGEKGVYLLLAESGKFGEAVGAFKRQHPLQYAIHGERVDANFRRMRKREPYVPYPLASFIIPGLQTGWDRSRTVLHLWGATNVGKTKLAQALLQDYVFIRHLSQLKFWKPGQGIIFDDCNFKCLDIEECLHICDVQDDTQINIKHSHASIERGTPRIITSNFADIWPADPAGALERRLFRWECKAPLHQPAPDRSTEGNHQEEREDQTLPTPRTPRGDTEGERRSPQPWSDREDAGSPQALTQEASWRLQDDSDAKEPEGSVPRRRSRSGSDPGEERQQRSRGDRTVIDLSQDDDVIPFFPREISDAELEAWELN